MTRVLGIDPGLDRTGWAIVEKDSRGCLRATASGLIHTPAGLRLEKRLRRIYETLNGVIDSGKPAQAAVEEVFFSKKTSTQANTTHARGVILLACELKGLPVCSYNPREIKKNISGSGSAEKPQMQRMVQLTLGLPELPSPDDVADGMAAAICHIRTAPMREAMEAVRKKCLPI